MAFIRHPQIQKRTLLVNLLVKKKLSLAVVSKMLEVPYNCLQKQAEQLLSPKEYEVVEANRERHTYTRHQREFAVQKMEQRAEKLLADNATWTEEDARRGALKFISVKYTIKPSLLRAWRLSDLRKKAKAKKVKEEAATKSKGGSKPTKGNKSNVTKAKNE